MLPDPGRPSAILRAVLPPDDLRVSVIIGTWNRAGYLGEAIRSILGQTVQELELIVADDGSTDGTDAVVAQYDDPRLRYLPGPHVGISRNLNRALAEARAPYAALLDSDDWSYPTRLERQLAVLDARPEVAAVGAPPGGGGRARQQVQSHELRSPPGT